MQVGDGPHAVVADDKAVWVSNEYDATLARIDPRTDRVVRRISIGSSPQGLALVGSTLWVAARAFAARSHRGGTLTVVTRSVPEIDPTHAYDPVANAAILPVYDGLVGLRRATGAAGMTVVPDLAKALPRPRPTLGGKTYTFTLRADIRYSNGILVRPADIRRGIERQFTAGGAYLTYYTGLVRGQACGRDPAHCDLSRGIVTDEKSSTVTFHLTEADPDFLFKLALPFIPAAPPGAPQGAVTTQPLPGTGPYMISSVQPGRQLTLVRNPYFRQWSYTAQPDGYPDSIH